MNNKEDEIGHFQSISLVFIKFAQSFPHFYSGREDLEITAID